MLEAVCQARAVGAGRACYESWFFPLKDSGFASGYCEIGEVPIDLSSPISTLKCERFGTDGQILTE
jgi:hypothetical protein